MNPTTSQIDLYKISLINVLQKSVIVLDRFYKSCRVFSNDSRYNKTFQLSWTDL